MTRPNRTRRDQAGGLERQGARGLLRVRTRVGEPAELTGIGSGSERSAVVLGRRGRARGLGGRRAIGGRINDWYVEHFAELAGFLNVAAGVRHGSRRHCGLPLLELLGSTRDIEPAAELVRWDSGPHFSETQREKQTESVSVSQSECVYVCRGRRGMVVRWSWSSLWNDENGSAAD